MYLLRIKIFSDVNPIKLLHLNLRLMKIYNLIFNPYSKFLYCPYNVLYSCFIPHLVTSMTFCFGLYFPLSYFFFFFSDTDLLGDPAQLFCRIYVWLILHDQIQIKHSWQEYYNGDLYLSQCITLGNTWYHFVPLLIRLNLITWLSSCQSNFSIIKVPFFFLCNY